MNKRIIIFLLLLFVPSALAKEEVIKKYKYYYFEREYGPYSEIVNDEYPFMDENDFIYTDYFESENIPENKPNREIEEVTYYRYKRVKNISYIRIMNYSGDINIHSIDIKYNGDDINYTITYPNDSDMVIKERDYILINFEEEIDQNLLTLKLESDASGSSLNIITGDSVCDQTIYRCTAHNIFEWEGTNATYYAYSDWVEDLYPFRLTSSRTFIYKGYIVKYRYRDKLYKIYKEIKKYSPNYLLNPEEPFIIKDENDFIEEIVKEEEVTNDNLDENNFIDEMVKKEESTNDNLEDKNVSEESIKPIELIDVPNTGINNFYEFFIKGNINFLHFNYK